MASALLENGFHKESQEYCMVLQLNTPFLFEVSYAIKVKNVKNLEDLKEFSSIIEQYDNRTSKIYHNKKIIKSEFVAKTLFFVAYVNQKAVGTGSLHFSDNNKAGIYDILVLEEYRGQGVASHMMKYLINYCQQRGIRQVSLSTSSKPGYRIYDKLGFKLVGKLECYEWAKN
ncbi:MAG: GNAT family N-acetyltransferase [Rickettsiaceae bacterium]|nr:GNAT family N-acetyltransferase [Rickettsiaceae bacterium]